jgi:UDP-N-acetylglucosamine 2-epimerase
MTALEFAERLDAEVIKTVKADILHTETAAMLRKQYAVIKVLRTALHMIHGDTRTCVQLDGHIKAALAATEEFK